MIDMNRATLKSKLWKLLLQFIVHFICAMIGVLFFNWYFIYNLEYQKLVALILVIGAATTSEAINVAVRIDRAELEKYGTRLIRSLIAIFRFTLSILPFLALLVGLLFGVEHLKLIAGSYIIAAALAYFFVRRFGYVFIYDIKEDN